MIELTSRGDDGSITAVLVNPAHVILVAALSEPSDAGNLTKLWLAPMNEDNWLAVVESPREIMELL